MSNKRSSTKKTLDEEPNLKKKVFGSTHKPKFTKLFINNEWVDSADGKTFDVINPTTEELICKVSRAGDIDAEKAV